MGVCDINGIGTRIDIRVVNFESYYTSLIYFTGSKDFNIYIRKKAIEMGFSLNEYCIIQLKDNTKYYLADEKELFKILEIPFIKPNKR